MSEIVQNLSASAIAIVVLSITLWAYIRDKMHYFAFFVALALSFVIAVHVTQWIKFFTPT